MHYFLIFAKNKSHFILKAKYKKFIKKIKNLKNIKIFIFILVLLTLEFFPKKQNSIHIGIFCVRYNWNLEK